MTESPAPAGSLHPDALRGLTLFARGDYWHAHEALESAWRADPGPLRALYQGLLQTAVTWLHVQRGNHAGAVKVAARARRHLDPLPEVTAGVHIGRLREDLRAVQAELERVGPQGMAAFDLSLLRPPHWKMDAPRQFLCDRCGTRMIERNCKVTCPACGYRFDCSDLTLHFD